MIDQDLTPDQPDLTFTCVMSYESKVEAKVGGKWRTRRQKQDVQKIMFPYVSKRMHPSCIRWKVPLRFPFLYSE